MNNQNKLFSIEQIRACEHRAINGLGINEEELMLRAGQALFRAIKKFFPEAHSIGIFCGSGNNAGDGYVLAKLAYLQGLSVTIYQCRNIENLPPAAQKAAYSALDEGIHCQILEDVIEPDVDLIIDGLLGIGIKGNVQDPIAHAINLINESQLPVLAIDLPSGLEADTGRVLGCCVKASLTVTFIGKKKGLFTLDGPDHAGEVICDNLELENLVTSMSPTIALLHAKYFLDAIPRRHRNSHKGDYGRILIIGGGLGMPGAAYLSALAALRVGAGLVTLATLPEHAGKVLPQLPEVIHYGIETVEDLFPLLEQASVIVIGPGLGESQWAQELFNVTITTQLPLVVDASALRLLAIHPQQDDNWILTPHPGEAAHLLSTSVVDIQQNRFHSATLIQKKYGGTVILKGVGTILDSGNDISLCPLGNPGMATAGMGDVLSGIIGGLLGQGVPLAMAAKMGVWLHAKAGDEAASTQGERGLLASDLIPYLRRLVNQIN